MILIFQRGIFICLTDNNFSERHLEILQGGHSSLNSLILELFLYVIGSWIILEKLYFEWPPCTQILDSRA